MKIPGDYHLHTIYCDGKNTPCEMVVEAVARGFESIGLSGHSYTSYNGGYGMTPGAAAKYRAEVYRLREQYRGEIEVYLGIEQEIWSEPAVGFDYIVGAAHYIKQGERFFAVDYPAEAVEAFVIEHFGGDWMRFVAAYYELAAKIPEITRCDFVAHFDLVAKCNDRNRFFDEESREYRALAYEALKHASSRCRVFELNSGAVSRGYRKNPYPAKFILKALKELGCEIILSSDAHDTSSLGFFFPEMAALARDCGFRSAKYVTRDGMGDYLL